MISKKQIVEERDGLTSLKSLVGAYEEIAAARMQRVRGAVVQSRLFLVGLEDVFRRVKAAYNKQPGNSSTLPKNGKVVAVFVSANSGLFGDIVDRTFEMFADYVRKNKAGVVVLGKLGVKMMTDRMPEVLYNYYDFSDESVDMESFGVIMRYLLQFEKILVFHGQFKTILTQEPRVAGVSGDSVLIEQITKEDSDQYLFEPSVGEIVRIFEGEILASIFEQTLHESMLAKFASRMTALDRSVGNIDKRLGKILIEGIKLRHKTRNRKQLSTISGMGLWR
jgi:ATP synthase F1 gamma subunit